ncbi:MAG: long-chain-fatty-acid--CoA ligase [Melioribacteraceae bacterium]|nr:MAG: long-chain-fatty-acid--CoA ligase [Melioribacteraceae bacterium]
MKREEILFDVPRVKSVQEMVLLSADVFKDQLALEDLNKTPLRRVTYEEMLENILRFGSALKKLGVEQRTHVALIGENRVQWGITFLTGMCFDFVMVPIDRNLNANEVLNIIHESDTEVVVFSDAYADMFSEHKSALKKVKHFICMDKAGEEDEFLSMMQLINDTEPIDSDDLPSINPKDLAEIIFTSGSLGRAKGVMLTQANLAANLVDMLSYLKMYPEDRFLSVLPMHHTYECTCGMLCPLMAGSSVHYSRSLKTIVDDLQKVKATVLLGVPLLYDKMFKRVSKAISDDKKKAFIVPKLVGLTNFTSKIGLKDLKKKIFKEIHSKFGGAVRLFIAGGAAPDPLVAKGLREFGFTFLQGYGLTECSPILALNRLDNFKDDAAGLPLPGVKLKINDPDENGSGEVWAKGKNIMPGYYKNEAQTKATFEDGWFKTGDIGFIDEDGFLHINGRMKNVIISRSGKNVFPEEIEDILNRSPYVLECLVYGEADDKHDEIISAMIVVDAEAFIDVSESTGVQITDELIMEKIGEVIADTNKQLSSYKHIKRFHIREQEFEKTTTQKIKRYLVKKNSN